jgi:hypothetical protein
MANHGPTGEITRLINAIRRYASDLTHSGAVTRLLALIRNYLGDLSFSGLVDGVKSSIPILYNAGSDAFASFSGLVSWVRSGAGRAFSRTVSGSIAFSNRLFFKDIYGYVTWIVNHARSKAGDLTMNGIVTIAEGFGYISSKFGNLFLNATLTVHTNFARLKDGVQSFSGTAKRLAGLILARTKTGSLNLTGKFKRTIRVTHDYSGILGLIGSVLSQILATLHGEISSSGEPSYLLKAKRTLSSAVSFIGGVFPTSPAPNFDVFGSLNIYGRIITIDAILKRITDAAISPVGTFIRRIRIRRTKSGILYSIGNIIKQWNKKETRDGITDFAGEISGVGPSEVGIYNRSVTALLDFVGDILRILGLIRGYAGTLISSGALTRIIECFRETTASFGFSGDLVSIATGANWRFGYLTSSGDVSPYYFLGRTSYGSVLTMSGTIERYLVKAKGLSGSLNFSQTIERYKDILYFGPPNP